MTFDSGASEPGFSFSNWNAASGAIFSANLANPSIVSNSSETFNFISFAVTGFLSDNTIEVTSNLGDSYTYSTNTIQTHTLNWMGVSTITFTRISGSQSASDHDNFVYEISETLNVENTNAKIEFTIFPNPVKQNLTIASSHTIDEFAIYDITGRKVNSGSLELNKINIENLKPGNYIIELVKGNNTFTKKFVKI